MYIKIVVFAVLCSLVILFTTSYFIGIPFPFVQLGEAIDEFNTVEVFYNGEASYVQERNISEDGYNIGLKWQCVEFVKRYYLEVYNHKMPNSYGNANDFYNPQIKDGDLNEERGLIQFRNPSYTAPETGDIMIFSGGYGHIAIVSRVSLDEIEIIQQNMGLKTRETFELVVLDSTNVIKSKSLIGRLRIP